MNNIIKTKKGFTLVELVIVIVIVGILSVISVPIYRGYVEKAKMTEGYVLLNAIAKAELAYHVKYGYFVSDGCYNGVTPQYLDIHSEGNKYFTMWEAMPRYPQKAAKASLVNKLKDGGYDNYYDDEYVDIAAGYQTPKGMVVLYMTACSNGGCSDIRSSLWNEPEEIEVAEYKEYQEEIACK